MKSVVAIVVALACLAGAVTTLAKRSGPSVTGFSFSPSTFAVAPARAATAANRHATTIRFRLSSRATVRIEIARTLSGRRSGGHCVKPTAKLSKRRACTRYVTAGKLVRSSAKGGRTTIAFSGRIGGKALKTGAYRATIVAIDKAKHHSKSKHASFTVVSAGNQQAQSPGANQTPVPPGSGSTACATRATNVRDGYDPWGGCFPGPSNTGVPVGTVLTNYTGPCTITAAGTVIDGKTINCTPLAVQALNVTVRNSKVNGGIETPNQGGSVTVTDTTIDAGDVNASTNFGQRAISGSNFTAVRIQAVRGVSGAWCEYYCQIRDSFICCQDRDEGGHAHESGIRLGSGTEPNSQQLIHNTIRCDGPYVPPDAGCSADITGYGDFDYIRNNLVEKNLLEWSPSGGFCAYGGSSASKPYSSGSNNTFQDNIFQRGPNRKCGVYGAMTDLAAGVRGNTWTNNRWDTGELMPSEG